MADNFILLILQYMEKLFISAKVLIKFFSTKLNTIIILKRIKTTFLFHISTPPTIKTPSFQILLPTSICQKPRYTLACNFASLKNRRACGSRLQVVNENQTAGRKKRASGGRKKKLPRCGSFFSPPRRKLRGTVLLSGFRERRCCCCICLPRFARLSCNKGVRAFLGGRSGWGRY